MSLTTNLYEPTELPFVRCLACGKVLGHKFLMFRLLSKTLDELGNQLLGPERMLSKQLLSRTDPDMRLTVEALDEIFPPGEQLTLEQLQAAYDKKRAEHLEIVNIERNRALDGSNINVNNISKDVWEQIEQAAEMYKNAKVRAELRLDMQRDAEVHIAQQNGGQPSNEPIDAVKLFRAIVARYTAPNQLTSVEFQQLSLNEQLKMVNYPFEDGDPDYTNKLKQLPMITTEMLDKLNQIPDYLVLPEWRFTLENLYQFRGYGTSGMQNQTLVKLASPLYGRMAMDFLRINRNCCQMYIAEPAILPGEVALTYDERQRLNQPSDTTLVLTSHRSRLEQAQPRAIRDFMAGKISAKEVYKSENSLSELTKRTASIKAPIETLQSGDQAYVMQAPIQQTNVPTITPNVVNETSIDNPAPPVAQTKPLLKPLTRKGAPLLPSVSLPKPRGTKTISANAGVGRKGPTKLPLVTFKQDLVERIQPSAKIPAGNIPLSSRVYPAR